MALLVPRLAIYGAALKLAGPRRRRETAEPVLARESGRGSRAWGKSEGKERTLPVPYTRPQTHFLLYLPLFALDTLSAYAICSDYSGMVATNSGPEGKEKNRQRDSCTHFLKREP